jgi:hypothetical protein
MVSGCPSADGWRRRAVFWHVCDPSEGRIHPGKKRRDVCATRPIKGSQNHQSEGNQAFSGPLAETRQEIYVRLW